MVPQSELPRSRRLKRSSYQRTSARRVCRPLDGSFLIDTCVHREDVNEKYFRATNAYMLDYHNESFVSYVLPNLARLVSSHALLRN
jgi:hypothetical protein